MLSNHKIRCSQPHTHLRLYALSVYHEKMIANMPEANEEHKKKQEENLL